MPGSARSRRVSSRWRLPKRSPRCRWPSSNATRAVANSSAAKPGPTAPVRSVPQASSAASGSTPTEKATCAITSVVHVRAQPQAGPSGERAGAEPRQAPRGLERRHEAGHGGPSHGQSGDEEKGAVRHVEGHPERRATGDLLQAPGHHDRYDAQDQQGDTGGRGRQHERLDEELPDDPRAAAAEGVAGGELLLPRDGARVVQDRDVRAGRQQQQDECEAGQRPDQAQLAGFEVPRERKRVRDHARSFAAAALDALLRAERYGGQAGGSRAPATSACARASVASGASRPKTTPSGPVLRSISSAPGRRGTQDPEVERELEAVRHDADDGVHGLAEPQLASDDVSRAGEAPLPDVVADDDDGGGAGRLVGVDDAPADERRHPRHPEPGGRDLGDRHEFDRSVGRDHVAPDRLEGADIIDRLQAARANARCPATPCPAADRPRGPRSGWRRSGRPLRAEAALHMMTSNAANTTAAMPIATDIASPPTSVSPQLRTSRRSPSLTSSHDESSQGRPRRSRSASSAWMRPPAAARASRAASFGAWPCRAELVFSDGKVSGKLALQVMVGPPATERAPYPPCPFPKRAKNAGGRHAGSSKSVCMTDTI